MQALQAVSRLFGSVSSPSKPTMPESPYTKEQVQSAKRAAELLNVMSHKDVQSGPDEGRGTKRKAVEFSSPAPEPPSKRQTRTSVRTQSSPAQKLQRISRPQTRPSHSARDSKVFEIPDDLESISAEAPGTTPSKRVSPPKNQTLRSRKDAKRNERKGETSENGIQHEENGQDPTIATPILSRRTRAQVKSPAKQQNVNETSKRQTRAQSKPTAKPKPTARSNEPSKRTLRSKTVQNEKGASNSNLDATTANVSKNHKPRTRAQRPQESSRALDSKEVPIGKVNGLNGQEGPEEGENEEAEHDENEHHEEILDDPSVNRPLDLDQDWQNGSRDHEQHDNEDEENTGSIAQTALYKLRRSGTLSAQQSPELIEFSLFFQGASSAWSGFLTSLVGIQKKAEAYRNELNQNELERLLGPKHTAFRVPKLIYRIKRDYAEMKDGSDSATESTIMIKQHIERYMRKLGKCVGQLGEEIRQNGSQAEALAEHIYINVIPELGELLIQVLLARNPLDGIGREAIQEMSLILESILRLYSQLRNLKAQPELSSITASTSRLRDRAADLVRIYSSQLDRIEAEEERLELSHNMAKVQRAYQSEHAERRANQQELYSARWNLIAQTLEEQYPDLIHAHGRNFGHRSQSRETRLVDDQLNLPQTPSRHVPTGPHNDILLSTPIRTEDNTLYRTPLTARTRRVDDSPAPLPREGDRVFAKDLDWTEDEEDALINGLQEYQGPSRYYDIFTAYSGKELAGRDMDAIERKAKSIKAALIGTVARGSKEYEDLGFLWSVSD